MKKSEMIEKLTEMMQGMGIMVPRNRRIFGGWDSYEPINKYDAEIILTLLELEGMLPPTTKLSVINATDNGWDEED